MALRHRLTPNLDFPRYAFVPGQTVHPTKAPPDAHQLAQPDDDVTAIRYGIDLFNHGYFWEAHEVWEMPWRAARRDSDSWLFRKALIRLAAAALKLRIASPEGVRAHAPWCNRVFSELAQRHPVMDGLATADIAGMAGDLADGILKFDATDDGAQPMLGRQIMLAGGP